MILSTDLLLSLIVIVIIFGISVNTVDNLIKTQVINIIDLI